MYKEKLSDRIYEQIEIHARKQILPNVFPVYRKNDQKSNIKCRIMTRWTYVGNQRGAVKYGVKKKFLITVTFV